MGINYAISLCWKLERRSGLGWIGWIIEVINDRCDLLRANPVMYDGSLGKYQLQAQGFLSFYL